MYFKEIMVSHFYKADQFAVATDHNDLYAALSLSRSVIK